MASVNSKDIPDEFNMFGELFTLYKKYYTVENNDDWWLDMTTAFRELSKRHPTKFCSELCIACIMEIERKYTESKKELPDK